MQVTPSNFGALLHLVENHTDPAEKQKKAQELMDKLDSVHLQFGLREQYRARLERLLSTSSV